MAGLSESVWKFVALGLAAGIAILALLVEPILGGSGGWRGDVLSLHATLEPGVTGSALRFEWRPVRNADRYVMRSWNADGELIAERRSEQSPLIVEEPALSGDIVFWVVEAWKGSQKVASSGVQERAAAARGWQR